jgi:hypothetical protein
MTRKLLTICLLLAPLAAAQDSEPKTPKTAAQQRQQCASYMLDQKDNAKQIFEHNVCYAYARGVKDAMDGTPAWLDETHKHIAIGSWQEGVTVDQIIRVFEQFASDNPALLNKTAVQVIRQSAEQANLYTYKTP